MLKQHPLLDKLNEAQQQAVAAPTGHLLVLAGAGSGKTRVLVHRIAWLLQKEGFSPLSILAVTFTNKAAHEMRSRIEDLCQLPTHRMWVGTFHGLAHRFLRQHWQEANLPQAFQILDADDQLRLLKRIHKSLQLDETHWPPKQSQWFINKNKEEGLRARHLNPHESLFMETMCKIYNHYEELCQRSGLVDFCELLLRSLETLQNNPELCQHYQTRFQHILVDEFQDTNNIQYSWLRLLAGNNGFLMAVGDDDQSIYSWRGAKIENLHRFTRDFSPVNTIRLEQNYRSTGTILSAANAVIENNANRLGKKLWTEGANGEAISLYSAYNERDEAYYVVARIRDCLQQGYQRSDIALLYRSNAQSRVLEEALLGANIPYRIFGGQKFFDRAEIKDALGYLRLIANRQDDAAFERIVNVPARGIGDTTLLSLREYARVHQLSLWETTQQMLNAQALSNRAASALHNFLQLIEQSATATQDMNLAAQTEFVLQASGLMELYRQDRTERGQSRVENLEELITATRQFTPDQNEAETLSPLGAFLAHVALETGENQAEAHTDSVNLMTLHAAKGLEFPVVFLCGMEEGLFPHKMSSEELNGLEEERRLCYVGMTRAMKKLYLSFAESRYLNGR
ncbi:MAG TPA: DNA helicase II, partial [Coxiellaceae bacterium]|nr:DNA helicase II [Coxiellaceae bacterium]